MSDIRFDDRVAIVTGAGGGLGRCHALELARRGAKVVVNDLGGSVDGTGGNSAAAEAVVKEIEAFGGTAIANGSSVTDDAGVKKMIDDAMSKWGRIDIIVANAGVLRDKSFSKMEMKDFEFVMDVHVMGSVKPIKAAWDIMKEQNYGRIVVTTSSTGLYGNFGQANYGAAKLGLVGLMGSLKIEGAKNNIKIGRRRCVLHDADRGNQRRFRGSGRCPHRRSRRRQVGRDHRHRHPDPFRHGRRPQPAHVRTARQRQGLIGLRRQLIAA